MISFHILYLASVWAYIYYFASDCYLFSNLWYFNVSDFNMFFIIQFIVDVHKKVYGCEIHDVLSIYARDEIEFECVVPETRKV